MQVNIRMVGMPTASDWEIEAVPTGREPAGQLMPIEMPEESSVEDLLARLKVTPDKILVNGDDADPNTPLHDGDAVALIGPAAGKE